MSHATRSATVPSRRSTGVARLLASLRGKGTGAPVSGLGGGRTSLLKPLSLAVAVTAASLALTASPALAAHHILGPTPIGEPCAAQPCTGAHLQDPSAVAVNEATDNVYVADTGNNRVEHFDLTATPA